MFLKGDIGLSMGVSAPMHQLRRPPTDPENAIYDHLKTIAQRESAVEVVHRYQQLFTKGVYPESPRIQKALHNVLQSEEIDRNYPFFFNRSCYIAVNNWYYHTANRQMISPLIDVFSAKSFQSSSLQTTHKLHRLIQQFQTTDQYRELKSLADFIQSSYQGAKADGYAADVKLDEMRPRYPFVCEQTLMPQALQAGHAKLIHDIRMQAQQQQQSKLENFKLHFKLSQQRQNAQMRQQERQKAAEHNFTFLPEAWLGDAIEQFDTTGSCHDAYKRFQGQSRWITTLRDFKRELYDYLMEAIPPHQSPKSFPTKLRDRISAIAERFDDAPLDRKLIAQVCKGLLDFLIVRNGPGIEKDYRMLIDLDGNVPTVMLVGLLLRILLVCRSAFTWLEQKLAVLFDIFMMNTKQQTEWLIRILEYVNVAICLNYPDDLSLMVSEGRG